MSRSTTSDLCLLACGGCGKKKSTDELIADLKVFPQRIHNVRVREKVPFEQVPEIKQAIQAAQRELDGNGRIVVRYSGTEALARVMVEAESEAKMNELPTKNDFFAYGKSRSFQ